MRMMQRLRARSTPPHPLPACYAAEARERRERSRVKSRTVRMYQVSRHPRRMRKQKLLRCSMRPHRGFIPIPLCFPLALQRGFASVAGRGDVRRTGVRVTRQVHLSYFPDGWASQTMCPSVSHTALPVETHQAETVMPVGIFRDTQMQKGDPRRALMTKPTSPMQDPKIAL